MENFMKTCLQKTSDKGFVSIAFPALGTGNLGYPRNVVARNMFSCVDRFSTSNPGTSVCDVRFVVYERDMNTIQVGLFLSDKNFWPVKIISQVKIFS